MSRFLQKSELTERRAFIETFVKEDRAPARQRRRPLQDISYPIDTKNLGIHGRLGLKAVDHDDCSQSLGWFNPPRAG